MIAYSHGMDGIITNEWRLLLLFKIENHRTVFDHIGIFVSNTERSFHFFEKSLAPLGIVVRERQRKWGSIVSHLSRGMSFDRLVGKP